MPRRSEGRGSPSPSSRGSSLTRVRTHIPLINARTFAIVIITRQSTAENLGSAPVAG